MRCGRLQLVGPGEEGTPQQPFGLLLVRSHNGRVRFDALPQRIAIGMQQRFHLCCRATEISLA